jgi:hypothetical protein
MPYGHTISTVNFMAGLLSNLVGESLDSANGFGHIPSS